MPRWLAVMALMLVAVALRVLDMAEFKGNVDHAYPIYQALTAQATGQWPGLGQITSVALSNPPGMTYVVAGAWLLGEHQFVVHVWVALLNALAVPLTFVAGRRVVGRPMALSAAMLVAVNPWLAYFSRGVWVQGAVQFWSALTLTALILGFYKNPRWQTGAGLALTGLTQMYLLAWLAPVQALGAVWLYRARIHRRALGLGLAVCVAGALAYALNLALDAPAQWGRLTAFWQTRSSTPWVAQSTALSHAARFVTGADYEAAWAYEETPAYEARRALSQVVSGFLLVALLAGAVWALWRISHRAAEAPFWLLMGWWVAVPVSALTVAPLPIHIAYLLFTVPAGAMLAAPAFGWLWRWRWGRWGMVVLTGALALHSASLLQATGSLQAARPGATGLDELTLRANAQLRAVARAALAEYPTAEFYVGISAESFQVKVGRRVPVINTFDLPARQMFRLGVPSAYVRLTTGPAPALPWAADRRVEPLPGGEMLTVDVLPAWQRQDVLRQLQYPIDWPSQEGLTLLGYSALTATATLQVAWLVEDLHPARVNWLYAPYAHVRTATGQWLANVSAPGLPGGLYRPQEVYLFQLALPPDLPPGQHELTLGLYDGVNGGVGITLLPPHGAPRPAYTATLTWP